MTRLSVLDWRLAAVRYGTQTFLRAAVHDAVVTGACTLRAPGLTTGILIATSAYRSARSYTSSITPDGNAVLDSAGPEGASSPNIDVPLPIANGIT